MTVSGFVEPSPLEEELMVYPADTTGLLVPLEATAIA
jgi:hypothetical protein